MTFGGNCLRAQAAVALSPCLCIVILFDSTRMIIESTSSSMRLASTQLDKERAHWLGSLIADQDPKLMVTAWREMMAFDSRRRLAEIACPTLSVAASNDRGVPVHHAKMLHDGIAGSQLVIVDGADHALIFTHPEKFLRVIDEFLGA